MSTIIFSLVIIILLPLFLAKETTEFSSEWRLLQDQSRHCSFDHEARKIRCKRVGFPLMGGSPAVHCQGSSCALPTSFASTHSSPCHHLTTIGSSPCDGCGCDGASLSSSSSYLSPSSSAFNSNLNDNFEDECASTASCSAAATSASAGVEPNFHEDQAVQEVEQQEHSSSAQHQEQQAQQQQQNDEQQGHLQALTNQQHQEGQYVHQPIVPQQQEGQYVHQPIVPQQHEGQYVHQPIALPLQQQSFAVENANGGMPTSVCQSNEDNKAPYCCNSELKQVMRDAYANAGVNCPRKDCPEAGCFHCCNIQKLASLIQHHCEQRFGVTFEVVVGLRDFSLHSHYYDNFLCKITEGESQIAAFASAQGVCLPDGSPANSNNGTIPAMCDHQQQRETNSGEWHGEKQQWDGDKCAGEKRGPTKEWEDYQQTEERAERSETNSDQQNQ